MSSMSMSSSPSMMKGNSSLLGNYHRQPRVSTPISINRHNHHHHHNTTHNHNHNHNHHNNMYNLGGGSPHGGSLGGGSTHIIKSPPGTNMHSLSSDATSGTTTGAATSTISSTNTSSTQWPKVPSLEGMLRSLAGVREDFVETLLLPQMSHKIGEFT